MKSISMMISKKRISYFVLLFVSLFMSNVYATENKTDTNKYQYRTNTTLSTSEFLNMSHHYYSDIQKYFDFDTRLKDTDQKIGFSTAFQVEKTAIYDVFFTGDIGELLPIKDSDGGFYKVAAVDCSDYIDENKNPLPIQKVQIVINNEKSSLEKDPEPSLAIIELFVFDGDNSHAFSRGYFISNLRWSSFKDLHVAKGPSTLGIISAKMEKFNPLHGIWWVKQNAFFKLDLYAEDNLIPEKDAFAIAQWVYEHTEFKEK